MRHPLPHEIALQWRPVRPGQRVDPVGQRQHAGAFPVRDADRAVRQRPGDLLQRQAVVTGVDELVDYRGIITVQAVLQADQQPVQPSGEVLVEAWVHGHHSGQAGRAPALVLALPGLRAAGGAVNRAVTMWRPADDVTEDRPATARGQAQLPAMLRYLE
jgi:hypothetical protein